MIKAEVDTDFTDVVTNATNGRSLAYKSSEIKRKHFVNKNEDNKKLLQTFNVLVYKNVMRKLLKTKF